MKKQILFWKFNQNPNCISKRKTKSLKTTTLLLGQILKDTKSTKETSAHLKENMFWTTKKRNSSFYKAIHISYPNEQDKQNAKEKGVSPGGAIMIHG